MTTTLPTPPATALTATSPTALPVLVAPSQPQAVQRLVMTCTDTLQPSPPDTAEDGWVCVEQPGHLPELAHRAADGTTW